MFHCPPLKSSSDRSKAVSALAFRECPNNGCSSELRSLIQCNCPSWIRKHRTTSPAKIFNIDDPPNLQKQVTTGKLEKLVCSQGITNRQQTQTFTSQDERLLSKLIWYRNYVLQVTLKTFWQPWMCLVETSWLAQQRISQGQIQHRD